MRNKSISKEKLLPKYGRLNIIGDPYQKLFGIYKRKMVLVKCDCGVQKEVQVSLLKNGGSKSCGCIHKEWLSKGIANKRHGLRSHTLYDIYHNIIQRCYNKSVPHYNLYGGRGIDVCEEWRMNFKEFYYWAIQNNWQKGLTVDRINNNLGYYPNNCRIVTYKVQGRNRRNNKFTVELAENIKNEYSKELRNGNELAKKHNVNSASIYNIINKKCWS